MADESLTAWGTCPHCDVPYTFVEDQGPWPDQQNRFHRECPRCGFTPDRR